jgi:hypothetical protein
MDGANVEIAAEINRANMFIFGAEAHEVPALRLARKTTPAQPYCRELTTVIDQIAAGQFGPVDDVAPILANLKWEADFYLTSHDFPLYLRAQEEIDRVYRNQAEWTRRCILSVAGMAKFSTDRTMEEYSKDIWGIEPCRRLAPVADSMSRSRSFPALQAPALGGLPKAHALREGAEDGGVVAAPAAAAGKAAGAAATAAPASSSSHRDRKK